MMVPNPYSPTEAMSAMKKTQLTVIDLCENMCAMLLEANMIENIRNEASNGCSRGSLRSRSHETCQIRAKTRANPATCVQTLRVSILHLKMLVT